MKYDDHDENPIGAKISLSSRLRAQSNRLVILITLVFCLPLIALFERAKPGTGRNIALHTIRLVAHCTGIQFHIVNNPDVDKLKGAVFVSNHRSPVDIAALLLARPSSRFLAAAELFRIPLLASAMRALGCIPVNRRNPRRFETVLDSLDLDTDTNLVVFAEGGIKQGPLGPFRTGAFRIAIDAQLPVVPVAILGSDSVLPPSARLRARPGTVVVRFGSPLDTAGLTSEDRYKLRAATYNAVRALLDQ
ncbi:MAG: hypothetical protein C4346_18450 [Chloroflexota bacterium]